MYIYKTLARNRFLSTGALLSILLFPQHGWSQSAELHSIPLGCQAKVFELCEARGLPDSFRSNVNRGKPIDICFLPKGEKKSCQFRVLGREFIKILSPHTNHALTLLLTKEDREAIAEQIALGSCFLSGPEETLLQKECKEACLKLWKDKSKDSKFGKASPTEFSGQKATRTR